MISSIHLPLLVLAISQTTCTQALEITPRDSQDSSSSQSLPLAATIGIIVGVISIFALATVLFIIYFARQRPSPYIEQRYYYREEYVSPKTLVEPWGYVGNQPHHLSDFQGAAHMTDGASETNGQYYNRMEEAARHGHIQLTHDPRSVIHGPDNAMPAHHAYDPNTVSKKDSRAGSTRSLSPPRPTHKLRPSTPDSFIIQAYKSVVEDASRQSALQSPPTSGQPALPSPSEPTSSPTLRSSSRWSSRLSSLSLPKIHIPKRNAPPSLILQPMAMVRTSADRQLHITPPLLNDPRFIDRPLGAGIVIVDRNRPPTPRASDKYSAYTEVPLASGKSVLYGM
ncbi:uncharacterized protein TRIVIDRAFT_215101 [Trichoderma virens Gv29-8]|uniref:Uncharacterized protein n=1 Tax=Hypocrea virens (strain Gv29-8 / FGSC 10586) TaxID=413071 RepID=G9MDZ4_HYPVG|nr:uncharacterized protein TRIVIDRAFT_215101 [Trichoderma virens Gv29-8]EHK27290.1 hypothetical protein TRIVIDRAFT_215101 [Trichoderma virens Gv29-8]UKZ57749.1 hypothetical protein TrVGV298_011610 [Trichoderma virens]